MQWCAVGLLEIAPAARAMQLAPQSTAGMTVGRDIAQAEPAAIRTGGTGTEMVGGVDLARPSSRGSHAGWRATGRLGSVLVGLLTGGTRGLAGEARKQLRVAGALARRRQRLGWALIPSPKLALAGIMQHDAEPKEAQQHPMVEKHARYHCKAPLTQ